MSDPYKEVYDENDDLYEDEFAEELEEDDEITPKEEAFMKGYNKALKKKKSKRSKNKHTR
ncbi:MAG: hypothetical protein AABX90_03040 [Nanoarchaeota archaeon]